MEKFSKEYCTKDIASVFFFGVYLKYVLGISIVLVCIFHQTSSRRCGGKV